MRKCLVLLVILISANLFADSKEELIDDIFNEIVSNSSELKDLPQLFEETRTALIDTFKPRYKELKDPEIIALQEKLYSDVKASEMYLGYMEGLKKAFVEDLDQTFTVNELVALKKLLNDPLLAKLKSVQEKNLSSGDDFTEKWTSKNEKLVNNFLDRQKAINDKLKVSIMKSVKNKQN
ncbi:MAG: hypothetical protein HWE27_05585 [Gammaproteobacteria bacterium]|nr:hypothetical protein [Gammaproteobacteria bacterium]